MKALVVATLAVVVALTATHSHADGPERAASPERQAVRLIRLDAIMFEPTPVALKAIGLSDDVQLDTEGGFVQQVDRERVRQIVRGLEGTAATPVLVRSSVVTPDGRKAQIRNENGVAGFRMIWDRSPPIGFITPHGPALDISPETVGDGKLKLDVLASSGQPAHSAYRVEGAEPAARTQSGEAIFRISKTLSRDQALIAARPDMLVIVTPTVLDAAAAQTAEPATATGKATSDEASAKPSAISAGTGLHSDADVIGQIQLQNHIAPPLLRADDKRVVHFDVLLLRLNWQKLADSGIDLRKLGTELSPCTCADCQKEQRESGSERMAISVSNQHAPVDATKIVERLLDAQAAERVSAPQIVTVEGQPAQVQVSSILPQTVAVIDEVVNGQPRRRLETRQIGEDIRLTPTILSENRLKISVDAESSQLAPPDEEDKSPAIPTIRSRVFCFDAVVVDGRTLMISELPPGSTPAADGQQTLSADAEHGMMLLVTPKVLPSTLPAVPVYPNPQPAPPRPVPSNEPGRCVEFEAQLLRLDWNKLRESRIDLPQLIAPRKDLQSISRTLTAAVEAPHAASVVEALIHSGASHRQFGPKFRVVEGREANLRDVTSRPIAIFHETVNGEVRERVEQLASGQTLNVTPTILHDNTLALEIDFQSNSEPVQGQSPPSVRSRKFKSRATLEQGQALIVSDLPLSQDADGSRETDDAEDHGLMLILTPTIVEKAVGAAAIDFASAEASSPTGATPAPRAIEAPHDVPPQPRAVGAAAAYYPAVPLGRRSELYHRVANLREAARNLLDAGLHDMAAQVTKQADEAQQEVRRMMQAAATQASATRAAEPADGLHREIRELRGEVHELRRDVGRLIELLEDRNSAPAASTAPTRRPIRGVIPRPNEQLVDVNVRGHQALSQADSLLLIKTIAGQTPSDEQILADVRQLYGTGWFTNVAPRLERGPDGLTLVFNVSESPVAQVLARQRKLATAGTPQSSPAPADVHITLQEASPEQQIRQRLRQPITLSFNNTPLSEALKHIATEANINVAVDRLGLEEEGVTPDVAVSLNVSGVTLATALKLMLEPLYLAYTVEDEVLKITSEQRSHGRLEVRNYSVDDFVPTDGPDEAKVKALERLCEVIAATIEPDAWSTMGGPGSIRPYEATLSLVVRQSHDVHEQIADLLGQLRHIIRGIQPEPDASRDDNKADKFYIVTYGVANLVNSGPADSRLTLEAISERIQEGTGPELWTAHGGAGLIKPYASTNSLIVRQTDEAHRRIAELLGEMRRERGGDEQKPD